MEKRKKAQVTIFIIVAILIIAAVILVFTLIKKPNENITPGEDPKSYIKKCVRESSDEIIKKITATSGLSSPKNYILWEQNKVEYFCYTPNNFANCINIHPMIKKEIELEIYNYTLSRLINCFEDIKQDLENYKDEALIYNVGIMPGQIVFNISKKISYTINENEIILENFNTYQKSNLFNILQIANEIVNAEAGCNCNSGVCNPDLTLLNQRNRDFEITKPAYTGSGVEVYRIKDINTNKDFNLAVRNCVRQ
jgi:hypothetical protein